MPMLRMVWALKKGNSMYARVLIFFILLIRQI